MSRIESADIEAALERPDLVLCLAVDPDFPSGHLRVTDAIGNVTIGGRLTGG